MVFPWNIRYPYVNDEIQNLDWTLDEVKKFGEALNTVTEGILAEANKYTDEQLANYQSQVEAIRREFEGLVNNIESDFDNLKIQINQSLLQMELKLIALQQELEADINAVNARTDLAIQQNNEYILSHLEQELGNVKVLNALTGVWVTIQDMFNYLCTLHATNSITYTELAAKNNTYTQLANYNMTYTQLAMNGDNIIV